MLGSQTRQWSALGMYPMARPTGLSQTDPEARLGPSGFDPSRR
jgi:hypothetical protein